jgi:hypothetical protein
MIQAQIAATLTAAVGEDWGSFNAQAAHAVAFKTLPTTAP